MKKTTDMERFDGLFATIADGVQGIQNLLDAFFGFLGRRTDFYSSPTSHKLAKEIVLEYFEKHKKTACERKQVNDDSVPKIVELDESTTEDLKKPETTLQKKEPKQETKHEQTTQHLSNENSEQDNSPPPLGNGGTTDKYTWTQTLGTVDIVIPLKECIKSSRLCKVNITSTTLNVTVCNAVLVEGKFHDRVKATECLWTLEDQKLIHITLEKQEGMKWWSCVLEGDPEIDTKKIQPENSNLSDLDPELRQTVEKMMFDQDQKARGLPTSDQRKQAEILESFKKQHPEMDFSQAKINWGGNSNQFSAGL